MFTPLDSHHGTCQPLLRVEWAQPAVATGGVLQTPTWRRWLHAQSTRRMLVINPTVVPASNRLPFMGVYMTYCDIANAYVFMS